MAIAVARSSLSVSAFAVHVGAAAASVPDLLVAALRPGGRMIIPVGPEDGAQQLTQVDKHADGSVQIEQLFGVRYVPLIKGLDVSKDEL